MSLFSVKGPNSGESSLIVLNLGIPNSFFGEYFDSVPSPM